LITFGDLSPQKALKDMLQLLIGEKMETIDLAEVAPKTTPSGKEILLHKDEAKIILYTEVKGWSNGKWPKEIVIRRFMTLDALTFEGLGLWVGEGGKDKGLYFGNSNPELLLHFLKFADEKLGINRRNFKVTLNVPMLKDENLIKMRWSEILQIPIGNFTRICIDPRISKEYAQIYYNSILLVELIKALQKEVEPAILSTQQFAAPFLRGMFAAEGQVAFRKHGAFYITFSSANLELVSFLKKCLQSVGITSGKYMHQSRKFPIYGYKNLKRFKELGIHTLHPEKRAKFELGFANYKRVNVLDGEEARALILQQLALGPKTYDELAAALGKARTTIQAHHIPILEQEGKVKRVGKRGQAWLFAPAEGKITPPSNVNRAPCEEPMSYSCKSPTTSRQALASSAP